MDNPTQRTVLVVEDNGEIGSQIEGMLQRKGHRVVIVSEAKEAIKIAETDRPAMILTDLDLPTFDSLIKGIREHATLKNIDVAIIDLNEPAVNTGTDVTVLNDFNQLDELIASTRCPIGC
jgi:CheY-like chemotaxis protein